MKTLVPVLAVNNVKDTMLRISHIAYAVLACAVAALPVEAQLDRHPETKTRALAWSEFDGSYLVDVSSRAEMLDFYWTVLARPYPDAGWTGSLSSLNAGTVSEAFRVREYSQLNAYRALQSLDAVAEDESLLPAQQQGALVLALKNQLAHDIDAGWQGYTDAARDALADSDIGIISEAKPRPAISGIIDQFVYDFGTENAAIVGHRSSMLWHNFKKTAIGAAARGTDRFVAVRSDVVGVTGIPASEFVAWPAPGYMPIGLFQGPWAQTTLRWSLEPSATFGERDTSNAVVTAKIGGRAVSPQNVQHIRGWPITWEFAPSDLNLATLKDDTNVEITVSNVTIRGEPVSYSYTVNLFDQNTIKPVAFAPRTSLANISSRATVGAGDGVLIAGFVVSGTLPVRVGIRTQGPSLRQAGIVNPVPKTTLRVYDAKSNMIAENTGWKLHQDWRLLQSLGVSPSSDSEAGMVVTLWPGAYTCIVSDDTGSNGVGIVEVFDIDNLSSSRVVNLSTRGVIGTGENCLIGGLIVRGDAPKTFLFRGLSTGLKNLGVSNTAQHFTLTFHGQDFADTYTVTRDADKKALADYNLLPPTANDIAGFVTLAPGAYTFVLSANSGSDVGVGLFEIYAAQTDTPVTLSAQAGAGATVEWKRNGQGVGNGATFAISNFQPENTGIYSAAVTEGGVTSLDQRVVGLFSMEKVVGSGVEVGADIRHQNGNIFDQVLLQGKAATITADKGQVTRMSEVDDNDDIIQVEFTGPGTLSLVMSNPSAPAEAVNYNQPGVYYVKGHAAIVIAGATEQTNVSVFSVGRATAVNQALFRDSTSYDGFADIEFIAIASANGKFGGARLGNVHFASNSGYTGLYAPGVSFQSVYVGNVTATGSAQPLLVVGSSQDTRITGGDLYQPNGAPVEVAGFSAGSPIKFTAGTDSHGKAVAAQANRGILQQGGVNVTSQIVGGL